MVHRVHVAPADRHDHLAGQYLVLGNLESHV
jgi:hypothetical protein